MEAAVDTRPSLPEVTDSPSPPAARVHRLLAFAGPAHLVSVGTWTRATGRPISRRSSLATPCCGHPALEPEWRSCCQARSKAFHRHRSRLSPRPARASIAALPTFLLWLACEAASSPAIWLKWIGTASARNYCSHSPDRGALLAAARPPSCSASDEPGLFVSSKRSSLPPYVIAVCFKIRSRRGAPVA